jgi:hypothetical protein
MSLTNVRLIKKISKKALGAAIIVAVAGQIVDRLLGIYYPSFWILGSILSAVFTVAGIFAGLGIQTIDLSRAFSQTLTEDITNTAGVATSLTPGQKATTR